MSSLDGQRAWRDFVNGLDDRSQDDYFRFNVSLPGEEPAIDDTNQMNEMRKSVHLQTHSLQNCIDTASALLISSFFFELTTPPQFESGFYHCQGIIRCRLKSSVMIHSLTNLHPSSLKFITETETLAPFSGERDVCCLCHRYCKRVEFYVRHPSDVVTVYLQIDSQKRRKISGFPQTMIWFVRQQNLDAVFGTSNHGDLGGLSCQRCILGWTGKKSKMAKRGLDPLEKTGYGALKRRCC